MNAYLSSSGRFDGDNKDEDDQKDSKPLTTPFYSALQSGAFNRLKTYHNEHTHNEKAQFFSYARLLGPALKPLAFATNKFIHALRPAAYASEVGESTKSLVPRWAYKSLYGVSGLYIILDTNVQVYKLSENEEVIDYYGGEHAMDSILVKKGGDTLLWHSLASFALPGLTIHQIVHFSRLARPYLNPVTVPNSFIRMYPPILGLMAIPFIIHPIDHFVDWFLDNTVRSLYSEETKQFLFINEKRKGHHHEDDGTVFTPESDSPADQGEC